jgi:hypothetical protein
MQFYHTVLFVYILTTATALLVHCLPFREWSLHIHGMPVLWYTLYAFGIVNNVYQIFTHIVTTLQYLGVPLPVVPGGADERQTPAEFTLHNQLDLWGWWAFFLLVGKAPPLENTLAAVHSSVGIVAWWQPEIFQSRYISTRHDTAPFWVLKTLFVAVDAIARLLAVWYLLMWVW